MVNFFKYTDPLRIISLLFILLILRIPFYLTDIPVTYQELEWMLIGEKLSAGFTLYKDVWTNLEPLSGTVYSFLTGIFGKSLSALRISGTILVYLQAVFFNYMCNRMALYNEKSSFPGLFYILFSCLFIDFYSLPPVLLSLTFILPAIYLTIIQVKFKTSDEGLLYLGVLIAVSSLFYFPNMILFPFFLFVLLLFTSLSFRKILLTSTGFLLPLSVLSLYHLFSDSFEELNHNLFLSFFALPVTTYSSYTVFLIVAALPLLLLFIAFVVLNNRSGYINFQFNGIKSMLILLVGGTCTILISRTISPSQLYILVPIFAFFSAHIFLLATGKILPKLFFWFTILCIPALNGVFLNNYSSELRESLYVGPVPAEYEAVITGKKILVVGHDPGLYLNSSLATPYYNWSLAERHFGDFGNMKHLSALYLNFKKDLPYVIIDRENKMEKIFFHIPILEKEYQKSGKEPIYILKEK